MISLFFKGYSNLMNCKIEGNKLSNKLKGIQHKSMHTPKYQNGLFYKIHCMKFAIKLQYLPQKKISTKCDFCHFFPLFPPPPINLESKIHFSSANHHDPDFLSLTVYKYDKFRLFQTERVCRQQF